MMRILHCIPSLQSGGAERQLTVLASLLRSRGWDVHVAFFHEGVFDHILARSATLHRVASTSNYDPRNVLRLAKLIRRIKPDIVQTWLPQMDVVGGSAALLCHVPWIIAERSSPLAYPPAWRIWLRGVLGRRAAGVIANSPGGIEFWQHHKGPRMRMRVIANAIDPSIATGTARATVPFPAGSPLVVYVGRLCHMKRIPILICAMDAVRRDTSAKLLICGEGHMENECRERVSSMGLDDTVAFAGFVADVPAVLRVADVFVSLSAFEGLPNAVQEAIACGTPVVLSDIPAHREIAAGDAALFVDGIDADAVAAAIVGTLRDRDAAHARARAASARAAEWSPAAIGAAYDAFYRDLLGIH